MDKVEVWPVFYLILSVVKFYLISLSGDSN